jgi:hypothetical protein
MSDRATNGPDLVAAPHLRERGAATADPIVKPSNAENIIRQWISVHGLSAAPSFEEVIGIHQRRVWNDANGHALIEAFSVTGMAHGVPLASATTEDSCGTAGAFFLEAGISSTHRIADFWCLGEGIIATPRAAAMDENRIDGRAVVLDAEVAGDCSDLDEAFGANAAPASPSFYPNGLLAKAFRELPFPKLPVAPGRATPHVSPAPIIEAALKATGLMRS